MLTLDQFAGEEFQGYVENVPPAREYPLRTLLPNETVFDLKFAYNVIDKAYSRTASITGFDSDAPLRDKAGLAKAFGEVSKVQHGFRISEEELLRFTNPRRDEERDRAIDYVYDNTDDLVQGVYDIEEWMRAQAIYKGRLQYSENGVVIDVDYGIPADNKMAALNAWSDSVNATPLTDIQAVVDRFKAANKGQAPSVVHISGTVKADLMRSGAIIQQVYGDGDSRRLVTNDQLNQVLDSLDLPPLVVNDMAVDNGEGEERLLPTRRIVALPAGEIGKTYIGPTVEKNFDSGIYVLPIIENKPPRQEVYVGETVFPAIREVNKVVWMDV
jgi:hypothetical protein